MNGSPPTMPKKTLPICLRFADQLVERVGLDGLLLHAHIDPAPLAAEVAGVDDRDVEERREELPALHPALVLVDRERALERPCCRRASRAAACRSSKSTRLASFMDASIVTRKPRREGARDTVECIGGTGFLAGVNGQLTPLPALARSGSRCSSSRRGW